MVIFESARSAHDTGSASAVPNLWVLGVLEGGVGSFFEGEHPAAGTEFGQY